MKFLGSHLYQLDDKGRVALPAAFRREAKEQRFVLLQAYRPALALYPESSWSEVEERLQDLLRHRPESRGYVLSITASAVEVVPDSQGRILIPTRLKEAAELGTQALLVGALDKIEIWSPDRFESMMREESTRFEQFAPQIFR